jgi:hypothetical protein
VGNRDEKNRRTMIVLNMELWPKGMEQLKEHLGTAIITNDVTGTETSGNYTVILSKRGNPKSCWKAGKVKNFPRKKRGAWDLLYLALKNIVEERNT